jgi:hypothetical protein
MICETCEGEGYVRGHDPTNPGALVMLPCLECNGSGIASCCDAAGSRPAPVVDPAPLSFVCPVCGMESFNTHDIVYRYCGACRQFTTHDPPPGDA